MAPKIMEKIADDFFQTNSNCSSERRQALNGTGDQPDLIGQLEAMVI